MSLQAFIDQYNGVPNVGDTPENRGQCVGLVEVWTDSLGLSHTWGNAKDLLDNADRNTYDVIANSPDNFPIPGDVLSFNGNWGGGVGHTVIVVKADANSFDGFEQNNPTGSAPRIVHHPNYKDVQGWMRPKNNQGGDEVITDTDNEYGRWNKLFMQIRGRNASREEFQNAAVGQTWLRAMEILSDDAEADAATHAQEIGQVAVRDQWDQQIYGLQAKVSDLTGQAQTQQRTITALNGQLIDAKTASEAAKAVLVVTPPTSTISVPATVPAAPSESTSPKLPDWLVAASAWLKSFLGTTLGRSVIGGAATVITPLILTLQNVNTNNAALAAAILAAVTILNAVKDAFNANVPNK